MSNDIVRSGGSGIEKIADAYVSAGGPWLLARGGRGLSERAVVKALGPLRDLARTEAERSDGAISIEVAIYFQDPGGFRVAKTLDALDREFRRIPPLLKLVLEHPRQDWTQIPLPLRPQRGGLRVRSAQSGSMTLFLEPYGLLEDVAQSGPVAVLSFLLLLWQISRIPRRLAKRWRLLSDGDPTELGGGDRKLAVFEDMVALGREAVDRGYDEIDLTGDGEGVSIAVHLRRREGSRNDPGPEKR